MFTAILESMTEELPAWLGVAYASAIVVCMGTVAIPLLGHTDDINTCKQAMSNFSDQSTFDAAYSVCEARGIVGRN